MPRCGAGNLACGRLLAGWTSLHSGFSSSSPPGSDRLPSIRPSRVQHEPKLLPHRRPSSCENGSPLMPHLAFTLITAVLLSTAIVAGSWLMHWIHG
uniref:Uncharacterized protein n=1 Tax=Solibacter usitatus (strain Ellin6076) TaxID=234267 RepID=Q01X20_SOLUE